MASNKDLALCLLVLAIAVPSAGDQGSRAKVGQQKVLLQCVKPNISSVLVVEWVRTDRINKGGSDYVFLSRSGKSFSDSQLDEYKGRVELQEPNSTNGTFSLMLRNVTKADNVTYECRIMQEAKGDFIPICTSDLIVEEKSEVDEEDEKKKIEERRGGETQDGGIQSTTVGRSFCWPLLLGCLVLLLL